MLVASIMPLCASSRLPLHSQPADGYRGLSGSDNAQALRIAEVLKRFTDAGVETWLRCVELGGDER